MHPLLEVDETVDLVSIAVFNEGDVGQVSASTRVRNLGLFLRFNKAKTYR